jgi:hypothetical protein
MSRRVDRAGDVEKGAQCEAERRQSSDRESDATGRAVSAFKLRMRKASEKIIRMSSMSDEDTYDFVRLGGEILSGSLATKR